VRQQINRASAVAIHPSLVCDQANALPNQRRKSLRLKHINSGKHVAIKLRHGNGHSEPQLNADQHGYGKGE